MHDIAQRFVTALGELHSSKDAGPIADLFTDDATLSKVGVPHEEKGRDGARTFWQQYREVFDEISSDFSHQVTDEGVAYLEWTSKGTLRDGTSFTYDGISVLEGAEDRINAFRTYYDTAAFLQTDATRGRLAED